MEGCTLGFAKHLDLTARRKVFAGLLETLEAEAQRDACAIIVVKSLDDEQAEMLHSTLMDRGYRRITCLPTVILDTRYRAFEDYMASLSQRRRRNFRVKLRSLKHVRFEFRSSLEGLETELHGLFDNTRMQPRQHHYNEFEERHPDYFRKMKQHLGDRLQVLLGWEGDELMSMIILLVGSEFIVAKDFGMKYPRGRELNLYFLSVLKLIEYAIERRMSALEMGVNLYSTKLQFGGRLGRRWLYLRFRGVLAILGPLAPLFDFERNDPELQTLRKKDVPKLSRAADKSDKETGVTDPNRNRARAR
jgi:predicted N-acyltransferase